MIFRILNIIAARVRKSTSLRSLQRGEEHFATLVQGELLDAFVFLLKESILPRPCKRRDLLCVCVMSYSSSQHLWQCKQTGNTFNFIQYNRLHTIGIVLFI